MLQRTKVNSLQVALLGLMATVTLAACVAPAGLPPSASEAPPLPARLDVLPNPAQQPVLLPTVTPPPPPTATPSAVLLRDWGEAPELTNENWLNSEPLRLADLRGKVVLIEFWTYG